MSPQEIAQRSADAMWKNDAATKWLGARIQSVGPGTATLSMEVQPHHTNGHGICHGGFIFTLADSAFAFACNSYDQRSVAQHCAVTFVTAGKLGQRLTAEAVERTRSGRSGIYDATVRSETGEVVAEFRGHSRTIKGSLLSG